MHKIFNSRHNNHGVIETSMMFLQKLFKKTFLLRGTPVLAVVIYLEIWITIMRTPYIKPPQPI